MEILQIWIWIFNIEVLWIWIRILNIEILWIWIINIEILQIQILDLCKNITDPIPQYRNITDQTLVDYNELFQFLSSNLFGVQMSIFLDGCTILINPPPPLLFFCTLKPKIKKEGWITRRARKRDALCPEVLVHYT